MQIIKSSRKTPQELRKLLGKPYSYSPGENYSLFYYNNWPGMQVYDADLNDVPAEVQIMLEKGKAKYFYFSDQWGQQK